MLLCSKSQCRSECVFSYWEKGDAVVELGLHPPSPVRAIWSCLVDFVAIVVQESGLFVVSCPSLKAPSEWTSWCLRVISQKGARKWIPPPPGSPASVQPLVSGNSARTKSGINMWSQGHFYEEPNLPWESAEKPLNCSANSNSRSCLRPTIEMTCIVDRPHTQSDPTIATMCLGRTRTGIVLHFCCLSVSDKNIVNYFGAAGKVRAPSRRFFH